MSRTARLGAFVLCIVGFAALPRLAVAAPTNDLFANAYPLTGTSGTVAGSNVGATTEAGEPNAGSGMGIGMTVWYSWTAPASGREVFDTKGSNFQTVLAVYTGSSVSALTPLSSSSDYYGLGYAKFEIPVTAGVTYRLQVDGRGYPTPAGNITLDWAPVVPPSNDNFANAQPLSGADATVGGTTFGATSESGEPHEGNRSVWYTFTPSWDGDYGFSANSNYFYCWLDVYTGSAPNALTAVALDTTGPESDCGTEAQLTAGTTYVLELASMSNTQEGAFNLRLHKYAPPNDDFPYGDIPALQGTSGTFQGDNVNATKQQSEPNHDGDPGGHSVWFQYTPTAGGTLALSTSGSDFATVIGVYRGDDFSTLVHQAAGTTAVSLPVTVNTVYRIAVDGAGGAMGKLSLSWSFTNGSTDPPPPNDNFANAQLVAGTTGSVSGTTVGATVEAGCDQSIPDGGEGTSIWFAWTAPASGSVTFDASGSSVGTVLEALHGCPNSWEPFATGTTAVTWPVDSDVTYYVRVDSTSPGAVALSWTLDTTPPPPNDDFANAQALTTQSGGLNADTDGATKEPGEPGAADSHSVWFTMTPTASGIATLRLTTSVALTMSAYTGTSVGALAQVAAPATRIVFPVTAGTTYEIQVDGAETPLGEGFGMLWNLPPPPANDDFANAQLLTGTLGDVTGSNVGATQEPGEPQHAGVDTGETIWYRWTAVASGTAGFSTTDGSTVYDTVLAVYTGGDVAHLTQVAANDDDPYSGPLSYVVFPITKGTTYFIAAAGKNDTTGDLALHWSATPANDMFADAQAISGTSGAVTGVTYRATREQGEPQVGAAQGTVWYRWTAPQSGTVTFDTCTNSGDYTALGVYTGTSVGALTTIADSGDTACGDHSKVWFQAAAGQTYSIVVEGALQYGDLGFELDWQYSSAGGPPSNDMFASREIYGESVSGTIRGLNIGATKEPGEPNHAGDPGGHSVWYQFEAQTHDMLLTLDTSGSGFSTLLAVYTGPQVPTVSTLTPIASSANGGSVQVLVKMNGIVYVAVDGAAGQVGDFHLNVQTAVAPSPPPNDMFASAQGLSGSSGTVFGTTVAATKEPGEPNHAGNPGGHSVWYRWTAPQKGTATFTTSGSSFQTLLAAYTGSRVSKLSTVASSTSGSVTFSVRAGATYSIAVDGYNGATGNVTLAWK